MHDKYLGLTPEVFEALKSRNQSFKDSCNDPDQAPVNVFSPRSEKSLAEIYLIREVSKELEKKKEEDMKKAAQKAEEPEEKPEEKTEEKPEEKTEDSAEEKKPETEK